MRGGEYGGVGRWSEVNGRLSRERAAITGEVWGRLFRELEEITGEVRSRLSRERAAITGVVRSQWSVVIGRGSLVPGAQRDNESWCGEVGNG